MEHPALGHTDPQQQQRNAQSPADLVTEPPILRVLINEIREYGAKQSNARYQ